MQTVFHINLLEEFVERAAVASFAIAGVAVVSGDSYVHDEDVVKIKLQPVQSNVQV